MLCGLMASQLELDDVLAKRCGLMHDIGKSVDRITEGTHTEIGADLLKRCKEQLKLKGNHLTNVYRST